MLRYKSCDDADRLKAVQLSKSIFKDNMDKQFLCLFGRENQDHMFIASEVDEVVSMVNYYPSEIRIGRLSTKAGSIGSVCTLERYRGQQIATRLLDMAEEKMLSEEIRIAIISGAGHLYERFGSDVVGNMIGFRVSRNDVAESEHLSVKPYTDDRFEDVLELYNQESIRFIRSRPEFHRLIQGQTYPDTFADYPFLLVFEDETLVGYVIVVRPFGKRTLLVKEFAGNRDRIAKAIPVILKELKKTSLTLVCDPSDELVGLLKGCTSRRTDLHASLKILDFKGLMKDLEPWIQEHLSQEELNLFHYEVISDKFRFLYGESCGFELDVHGLNALVFGPNRTIIKNIKSNELKQVLKKIFPIPFVWVNNLNYQ